MSPQVREKLRNQSHTEKALHHTIRQLATSDNVFPSEESMNSGKRAFLWYKTHNNTHPDLNSNQTHSIANHSKETLKCLICSAMMAPSPLAKKLRNSSNTRSQLGPESPLAIKSKGFLYCGQRLTLSRVKFEATNFRILAKHARF